MIIPFSWGKKMSFFPLIWEKFIQKSMGYSSLFAPIEPSLVLLTVSLILIWGSLNCSFLPSFCRLCRAGALTPTWSMAGLAAWAGHSQSSYRNFRVRTGLSKKAPLLSHRTWRLQGPTLLPTAWRLIVDPAQGHRARPWGEASCPAAVEPCTQFSWICSVLERLLMRAHLLHFALIWLGCFVTCRWQLCLLLWWGFDSSVDRGDRNLQSWKLGGEENVKGEDPW